MPELRVPLVDTKKEAKPRATRAAVGNRVRTRAVVKKKAEVIVISDKEEEEEVVFVKEVVMADLSGGLSANRVDGQEEEEGNTAPFPDR
nr:casein kinase 1-like protein HD16 [Tanacetum cinerariifolium]